MTNTDDHSQRLETAQFLAVPNLDERLPPNSPEGEQGALGCILLSPAECLPVCMDLFGSAAALVFYDLRHQTIYSALLALFRTGRAIDIIVLQQHMKDRGTLEMVGGVAYLATLPDLAPSAANLLYYTEILVEKWRAREALAAITRARFGIYESAEPIVKQITGTADRLKVIAGPNNGRLPAMDDVAEFLLAKLPEPEQVIRGVLHRAGKLVLGGGSKSYKTWTLLDMAVSVASGRRWIGFDTTKVKVLYVNFELAAWTCQQRLRAIALAKELQILPEQITVWNLRGKAARWQTLLPLIRDKARALEFGLIILDPIYKLYGGTDENSAGDVAALLNGVEDLATETGAAVAFGAHFSKGNQSGKESIDRISGTGVFARDPDALLVMTRHEEEEAFTIEATLRTFKPVEPFVVRWDYPLMVETDFDPSKLRAAPGRPPEHKADELMDLLGDGLLNVDWLKAAKEEQGISERTFYRLRDALLADERVLKSKINGRWVPVLRH